MNNTYLFILEQSGKRKATFLLGVHGKTIEELMAKAQAEYPGSTYLQGGDDYFNEFAQGKIYVNGEFVPEPPYVPPLEEVKAAKLVELKAERDRLEVEPVRTEKGLFDYDEKARDRIQAAIIALNTGGQIEWTLADNTNVTVTNLDLEDVVRAVAVRSNTLHVTYRQLKEAVLAAQSNEEVEEIHWPED